MERLTMASNKGGLAFAFDLDITCNPSEARKIQKLGEKLKAYEDTGLSPADIPALTARAEAAEAERDAAVKFIPHICCYCKKDYYSTGKQQCKKQKEDGIHAGAYTCGEFEWRGPVAGKGETE